jgi:hypothetical protein
MMLCADYRRALLADPQNPTAEMRQHVALCDACAAYTGPLLRFEGRLDRALRISLAPSTRAASGSAGPRTPSRGGEPAGRPERRRNRWLAAAASVLIAAGVTGFWLVVPGRSLAAAVVGHMAEEPDAWSRTGVPVAQLRLDGVLGKSHVRLRSDAGLVSYANHCLFRGHGVPHLVVQTPDGPVTVMVLPQESVIHAVHFDEQGYHGVIVPVPGHGSLAVLERGETIGGKAIDAIAVRVRGAIDYLP